MNDTAMNDTIVSAFRRIQRTGDGEQTRKILISGISMSPPTYSGRHGAFTNYRPPVPDIHALMIICIGLAAYLFFPRIKRILR